MPGMAFLHVMSSRAVRATACCVIVAILARPTESALGDGQPYLVKDINPTGFSAPTNLAKAGDRLFFNADDGVHGQELWVSDGTEEGTYMVIDLVPGPDGSVPQWPILELNGRAMFQADNNINGMDWYISDGTAAGTSRVGDVDVGGAGIDPETCGFWSFESARAGQLVYFRGYDSAHGWELWKTDGTPAGSGLLKDIVPGPLESTPSGFAQVGNDLFFEGNGDLWKSDGTSAGTTKLTDVYPLFITDVGGKAFFDADDGINGVLGIELWTSDGTPAGTHVVKDIYPGSGWSFPASLAEINGLLFFNAYEPVHGTEMWTSDGTEAGTALLVDLQPGPTSSGPALFTLVDGTIFFIAYDPQHGAELWKTDGTAEGTVFVKDIAPGPTDSNIKYPIASFNKLYFWADDGVHGQELWESDGSETGTRLVAEIKPGPNAGGSGQMINVNGVLFFSGSDGVTGAELWAFDTRPAPIPALSSWSVGVTALTTILLGTIVLALRAKRLQQTKAES